MLLLRRLAPYVVGMVNACLLFWQAQSASWYPWLAAAAPVLFAVAGVFVGWRRFGAWEFVARLLGPLLAVTAAAFALLLAEGPFAEWLIPFFVGVVSYAALELLFLLAFLPTRYPVNGLSHLNLALVPATLWCASYASVGLTMFIQTPRVVPVLVLAAAGVLLFWCTAHVDANADHRRRWTLLGGWVGIHLGLLGAFLPVNIALHGGYAAILGTYALRARRYGIAPAVPRALILAESLTVLVVTGIMIGTARWV
jgi:hypothetical protein